MMFASISGGTEIIGCFMIGNPTLPVRRGQLTSKALGHAVDVLDERNASVIGRKGDLVCTEPFPSMPLTFWGEGGDQRYHDTYFAQRPGHLDAWRSRRADHPWLGDHLWPHRHHAEAGRRADRHRRDLRHGRDAFTKSRIAWCSAPRSTMTRRSCSACKPIEGGSISAELAGRIRKAIRDAASPRHVPHRIHAIAAVPYTLNGKRVEGAARATMLGEVVKNRDSLSNPEALEIFRTLNRDSAL